MRMASGLCSCDQENEVVMNLYSSRYRLTLNLLQIIAEPVFLKKLKDTGHTPS